MYYFYVLRCFDNSLYCGQTNDLEKRVKEHNSSLKSAKYTRGRRPVKLVHFEKFISLKEAVQRETEVKKWSKEKKETLIRKKIKSI